jgi:trimethylamine--corrinoid protein Co-methyltransferase
MSQVIPRITVLSAGEIAEVHARSLEILATVGVRVDSPPARALLARAAGGSAEDGRVRVPADLVEWALRVAPADVAVFGRSGAALQAGTAEAARASASASPTFYQDPLTDAAVPFTRAHGVMRAAGGRFARLRCRFNRSAAGPAPDTADLYATLRWPPTPSSPGLLVSEAAAFEPAWICSEALCGSRPRSRSSSLRQSRLAARDQRRTSDKMAVSIARGLPVIYSNYGMSGATTPITPAGTLALLNAELLAGLALAQLMREGAPVILGILPAGFDMATAASYYGPETMLLNLACGEMMAHYRLPHCGTSGSGAGWGADLLAADLFWMNHLTSCLGSVGLAPFVGGNFDSLAFSPAAAVYADHVIRQARRFASGFALDAEALGMAEIAEVGPGGNFLTADLTLRRFREAAFQSPVFPRLSLEAWQEMGNPRAEDILRRHTVELMAAHPAPPDRADLLARGEAFIERLGRG